MYYSDPMAKRNFPAKKRSKVDAATSRLEDAFDRSKGLFLEEAAVILRSTLCGQSPNAVPHSLSSSVQPGKSELIVCILVVFVYEMCMCFYYLASKIGYCSISMQQIILGIAQLPVGLCTMMRKMRVRRRNVFMYTA